MLEAFKKFVAEFTEGEKHPSRFEENDYRLAAVALLVHAATIDGLMSEIERDRLHAIVRRVFSLDQTAANELIVVATEAEREAVDLYRFTRLINRTLDEAGRQRVVEMLWEMALADGNVTEFEDNLIWRAADLLGISGRTRIELRQQVAAQRAKSGGGE
jgi:uncharacterized tellurite resistance protein B-like protein